MEKKRLRTVIVQVLLFEVTKRGVARPWVSMDQPPPACTGLDKPGQQGPARQQQAEARAGGGAGGGTTTLPPDTYPPHPTQEGSVAAGEAGGGGKIAGQEGCGPGGPPQHLPCNRVPLPPPSSHCRSGAAAALQYKAPTEAADISWGPVGVGEAQ